MGGTPNQSMHASHTQNPGKIQRCFSVQVVHLLKLIRFLEIEALEQPRVHTLDDPLLDERPPVVRADCWLLLCA